MARPCRAHLARPTATVLALLVVALAAPPLLAQEATVTAPAEVAVGAAFQVSWTGPGGPTDFISLDPAGAPERSYGPYEYAKKGSPLTLRAPGKPGSYAVRYHLGGSGYPVIASAPVEVVAVDAELRGPATVAAGEPVIVSWTGPGNERDFVSIDPAGAPEGEYGGYEYTASGGELTLTAPTDAGDYEVRYHLGVSGYPVIGAMPLNVTDVTARLEAPAHADAGATVTIAWEGPGNERDFISIDPAGASDGDYGRYVYVDQGSPVELVAPDEPGDYAIRYHLGSGGYRVVGASPLTVGGVGATVEAVGPIVAGEPFAVRWSGPDHERDFVTIVPLGTPEKEYRAYAYTRRGNPLRVMAPEEPGSHELRYLTGQSYLTLASTPVEVTPGDVRGTLRVVAAEAAAAAPPAGAVEVILDASGSMLQRLDGTRRIELARAALLGLVGDALPAGTPFALRVFGHREADSCRTDLEIPLGPLDREGAAATLAGVQAMNLAKTPIAASLAAVRQDLATADGPRLVVLLTDGEETCDGDPAAAIRELAAVGTEVQVNIVGFAIDELMVKEQFERWARLGGGRYLDAADGGALGEAVRGALAPTFQVLAGSEMVATGTVGGEPIELVPGTYRVTSRGADLGEVTITAREETRLAATP